MYILNITNDYDKITDYDNTTFTDCTNTKNDDFNIIFECSLLSIPSRILLFFVTSLMVYGLSKLYSITKKRWKDFYTQTNQLDVIQQDRVNVEKHYF